VDFDEKWLREGNVPRNFPCVMNDQLRTGADMGADFVCMDRSIGKKANKIKMD